MSAPGQHSSSFSEDPVLGPIYSPNSGDPPPLLQRQFAQHLTSDVEVRLLRAERRLKWIVPVSVATGIACGMFITLLAISHMPVVPHTTAPAQPLIKMQDKSPKRQQDPELWIAYISELLLDNKIDLALQELTEFKQKYPEYSK